MQCTSLFHDLFHAASNPFSIRANMPHGSHNLSSSKRASLDSDNTSESGLARHSRDHGHRRPHGQDIEAQQHVAESLHPHVRIQENPDHRSQHVVEEEEVRPKGLDRADTGSIRSLRRRGRVDTTNVIYGSAEMGRSTGWTPGQEPGIDTTDPTPPYSHGNAIGGDLVASGQTQSKMRNYGGGLQQRSSSHHGSRQR